MPVKTAIILAAGKGTRMGPIGTVLAKPVWPFFESTLLELQIKFLKENYGIKKFFINSHHLSEQLDFIKSDTVEIVNEPVLLDQGGGILNILSRYDLWDEPVLINNADQLYFFDKKYFLQAESRIEESDVVLFGLKVNKEDGYNKLETVSENLKSILLNGEVKEDSFLTYSGMSLLKCSKSLYNGEVVSFFKSVANIENKKVIVQNVDDGQYFDFGKLDTYYDLCFSVRDSILHGKPSPVKDLLGDSVRDFVFDEKGLNFSSDKTKIAKENEILLNEGRLVLEGSEVKSSLS